MSEKKIESAKERKERQTWKRVAKGAREYVIKASLTTQQRTLDNIPKNKIAQKSVAQKKWKVQKNEKKDKYGKGSERG